MSTDTATQRLRDTQIQEYRDPETHFQWITEVLGYARTWGWMHGDKKHTDTGA